MSFQSLYSHGFARVSAVTCPLELADPMTNAERVIEQVRELGGRQTAVVVFPELNLCGYSVEDLVMQDVLLDDVLRALKEIADRTADTLPLVVVGAPLRKGNRLYNCAVVIKDGEVLGVAPKSYLPNYREFYEKRWFAPGDDQRGEFIDLGADLGEVPFGPDLVYRADDLPDLAVHVEICEDLWVPVPPSSEAALAGATVLVNLSGSPITIAKAEDRRLMVRSQSARTCAAYVFAAGGEGESTTDLAWDGQTLIYDQGALLAETERFPSGPRAAVADVDLDAIVQERRRQGSFDDNRRGLGSRPVREIPFTLGASGVDVGLLRAVERFPFVPADDARLAQDCYEAYEIQVSGLERRLRSIGTPKIVIGVSGGLDSTHALIVAAKAMDRLGRPRTDILAYTMPGFATSDHTKNNAYKLGEALGVTFEEIDIRDTAMQMLKEIGHPFATTDDRSAAVYDVTFENVQAGLRTDYLFRLANQRGGIVLGTGDLSELALGWCTYGVGDQMSHYGVNSGVPKTLMQHLIRWVAASGQFEDTVAETLHSILGTEISPELVPVEAGAKPQSTEASIGPYNLQDFTLYHVLRRGFRPSKIAFLAQHAWSDADAGDWPSGFPEDVRPEYTLEEIRRWMEVFYKRFFSQQFKRTAMPNGPKVLPGGSLSPRGDWRMPSDAVGRSWLAELERNVPKA